MFVATLDELRDALEAMAAHGDASPASAEAACRRAQDGVASASAGRSTVPATGDRSDRGGGGEISAPDDLRARARRTSATRWAKGMIVAAAVTLVIAGVVGLNRARQDQIDVVDDVGTPEPPPLTSTPSTPTVAEPVDPWAFEVDLIDVEGRRWSVAADESSWWGVPIAGWGQPAQGADRLFKLDLDTNVVVSETPIAGDAVFVAAGAGSAWVGHAGGVISRVDPEADTVVARIDVGSQPYWIDVGVDAAWVATSEGVVRVDLVTNTVVAEIDTGSVLVVMEGADGVWAWNVESALRIDPDTNSVVASIGDEQSAGTGFAVGPDSVWRGVVDGFVARIDPETNAVGALIEIEAPDGSAAVTTGMNVAGGSVWVLFDYACEPGPCESGLARIEAATGRVVAMETLPEGARGTIRVGASAVWVPADDQVARIDL